jgi:AAA+ superfamily predicted ATPase
MGQHDYIKDLARYGLQNDQKKLRETLSSFISYSQKGNRASLAMHMQTLLKESRKNSSNVLSKVGSKTYDSRIADRELQDIILENLQSDLTIDDIIVSDSVKTKMTNFIKEHRSADVLIDYGLTVSNKLLLHGPSGCGKTLASYVLSGELDMKLYVVNLGAIVSSKLGDTSKNIAKLFRKASSEKCIVFFDEFDSLGKVRNYDQDHGEMKRVVNTLLQLFDYLPQDTIVIAATNQKAMLDKAIVRRFDSVIEFGLPSRDEIKKLIDKTLRLSKASFDNKRNGNAASKACEGLSFYSIQKTLVTAIKHSLLEKIQNGLDGDLKVKVESWKSLIHDERAALSLN